MAPGFVELAVGERHVAEHVHEVRPRVDAALLLGMSRYAAASSPAARFALIGAALAICAFLALAVWRALPPAQPQPPERSRDFAAAVVPPPNAGPAMPLAPEPHPPETKTETPKGDGQPPERVVDKKKPEDIKKKGPMPVLGEAVLAPLAGREVIGALDTSNPMIDAIAIVVTHGPEPGSAWERIESKAPEIRASDPIMALPGYKADLRLKSDVFVHLWGNAPEQIAMKAMVMQSRVRLHPAPAGFDADLTLDAGRIYLSTVKKTGGAKVRVRLAGETWDITLADEKSEVMVQAHTAFVPGTPYARQGGEKPRTEARLAVVRGTAAFSAPARFKKYDKLTTWSEISWDSKSGRLGQPKAIEVNDPFTVRVPLIGGELGQATQKALSDAAQKLTDRKEVRVLLEARMNITPVV